MDAERWKRVDELLQAALQVPARHQEEFLRQQCGGDSELLEEVRSLLTSHRKAGSFLESPGLHVAEVAAQLPTRCGCARLCRSDSLPPSDPGGHEEDRMSHSWLITERSVVQIHFCS